MSLAPERPRDGASPSRAASSKARALIPAAPVAPVARAALGAAGPPARHGRAGPGSGTTGKSRQVAPANRARSCHRAGGRGVDGGGAAAASRPAPPPRAARRTGTPGGTERGHRAGTPRHRAGCGSATSWAGGSAGCKPRAGHRPLGMSLTPGDGQRALGTDTELGEIIDPWGCH